MSDWRKKQASANLKAGWAKNGGKIMAVTIVALVVLTIIGFASLTTPPPDEGTGEFEVLAWDGGRGMELPAQNFDWELYGIEGTDLTDFGTYDLLATGDSLADIGQSDLDTDYDTFVVKASGMVEGDWWDVDDPNVEDIDTTYDHDYYARWFVLGSGKNYLIMYETPSAAGFTIVDSGSAEVITAMPVLAQTNFTVFAFTNMSQPFARYVTGPNFENENNDQPEIVITFDSTISMSIITCQGATKVRVNDTAIRFTFGVLSSTPSIFKFVWDDSATTEDITDIQLNFGETELAEL